MPKDNKTTSIEISLLQERLTQLRAQRDQLTANLNAVAGAIAVLEQLLNPPAEPAKN